jgi:hypothetical protein
MTPRGRSGREGEFVLVAGLVNALAFLFKVPGEVGVEVAVAGQCPKFQHCFGPVQAPACPSDTEAVLDQVTTRAPDDPRGDRLDAQGRVRAVRGLGGPPLCGRRAARAAARGSVALKLRQSHACPMRSRSAAYSIRCAHPAGHTSNPKAAPANAPVRHEIESESPDVAAARPNAATGSSECSRKQ